jgi:hypothetical protein
MDVGYFSDIELYLLYWFAAEDQLSVLFRFLCIAWPSSRHQGNHTFTILSITGIAEDSPVIQTDG